MNTFNFNIKENYKHLTHLNTPVRNISNILSRKKTKIYISLTTSPLRLKYIPLVLSLLDLTHVHEIHINLPILYRNKKSQTYSTQTINYIKSLDSRIKIFRTKKDLGPITKILPTLLRIHNKNSIIISIDDDIGYKKSLVNDLVYFTLKYPTIVWGGEGFNFGDYLGSDFDRTFWPQPRKGFGTVDILEGFAGIAYPKWLINNTICSRIYKNIQINTDCKLSDDLVISEALAHAIIKRKIIPGDRFFVGLSHGSLDDALHKGSGISANVPASNVMDQNMAKYQRCIKYFNPKED